MNLHKGYGCSQFGGCNHVRTGTIVRILFAEKNRESGRNIQSRVGKIWTLCSNEHHENSVHNYLDFIFAVNIHIWTLFGLSPGHFIYFFKNVGSARSCQRKTGPAEATSSAGILLLRWLLEGVLLQACAKQRSGCLLFGCGCGCLSCIRVGWGPRRKRTQVHNKHTWEKSDGRNARKCNSGVLAVSPIFFFFFTIDMDAMFVDRIADRWWSFSFCMRNNISALLRGVEPSGWCQAVFIRE